MSEFNKTELANKASEKFKSKIKGLHPDLVLWLGYMLALCPIDFFIAESIRTAQRQQELYAQGRTAPGKKVTNVDGVVRKSMHQIQADGYGHAVDLYFVGWNNTIPGTDKRFKELSDWGKKCAALAGVDMRFGIDWKSPFDPPHYEIHTK